MSALRDRAAYPSPAVTRERSRRKDAEARAFRVRREDAEARALRVEAEDRSTEADGLGVGDVEARHRASPMKQGCLPLPGCDAGAE